jgi:hypothetical protein
MDKSHVTGSDTDTVQRRGVKVVVRSQVTGPDRERRREKNMMERSSVADPGSGAFLTPGSGIPDG